MSRAGRKAFNRCDVKVVEFKDFVYVDDDEKKVELSSNPSEDTRFYAGTGAILHCPRTEDERVNIESQYGNHSSRLDALASVGRLAGELLCKDCRYSAMNPVEVMQERAALARAEAERLDGMRLRAEAIAELAKIDPAFKDID